MKSPCTTPCARAAMLALAAGALWLAPTASAAVPASPWVITDNGAKGPTVIAGFHLPAAGAGAANLDGPLLRELIHQWGPPASRRAYGRVGCQATWTRPRIQATVANFGSMPRGANACQPGRGKLQMLRTLGRSWLTSEGLRVGMTRARLRAIYPSARPAIEGDRSLLILTPDRYPCRACTGPEDLAAARRGAAMANIPGARVQRFVVWVGAAGD